MGRDTASDAGRNAVDEARFPTSPRLQANKLKVFGEGLRGGRFYKKGLPASFFPFLQKQNLRDPIAFIPEVQALSAPGGLGLQGLAVNLVMNFRMARNRNNIDQREP